MKTNKTKPKPTRRRSAQSTPKTITLPVETYNRSLSDRFFDGYEVGIRAAEVMKRRKPK